MKIVAIDPLILFKDDIDRLNNLGEFIAYNTKPQGEDEVFERAKDADIIIDFWTPISGKVIDKLEKTKLIISAASGADWIDVEKAVGKGITVAHCPGHNAESVAEHTVSLILSAIRNTFKAALDVRRCNFNPESFQGTELRDSTVGIIGYGLIGSLVGKIVSKGFGAKVLYVNSKSDRHELEELLRNSDIISVNAPLNKSTRKMLGRKEFDLMKDGVVIVNTGRGEVIDEEVLYENLISGKVSAAGLDVMSQEPFDTNSPLFLLDNVLITPHIAYNTVETDRRLSQQVSDVAESFVSGNTLHTIHE